MKIISQNAYIKRLITASKFSNLLLETKVQKLKKKEGKRNLAKNIDTF